MSYTELTKESTKVIPTKIIPIPVHIDGTRYSYGTECTNAVLRFFGYADSPMSLSCIDDELDAEEIASLINRIPHKNNGKEPFIHAITRRYMTVCDLIADINSDIPVICLIQAWGKSEEGAYSNDYSYKEEQNYGHPVVAIGYDKEKIYFFDPQLPDTYSYIPISELEERWHDTIHGERYVHTGIEIKGYKRPEFAKKIM